VTLHAPGRRPRPGPGDEPPEGDEAAAHDVAQTDPGAAEAGIGALADSLPWAPRNLIVPYLLLMLSAYQAHGYWLKRQLETLGFMSTNITTIYRTLRQMEKQGLVTSYWQPTDEGPAQRVYTLTDLGRATLNGWAGALQGYRSMIDAFFRMYGLGAVPPMPGGPGTGAPGQPTKEERE